MARWVLIYENPLKVVGIIFTNNHCFSSSVLASLSGILTLGFGDAMVSATPLAHISLLPSLITICFGHLFC